MNKILQDYIFCAILEYGITVVASILETVNKT